MGRKKQETLTLAVRVDTPAGVNAAMVLEYLRDCLEYGKNEIATREEKFEKMQDLEFRVRLTQRITNYG